jgi:queuosine precursor transporter
MERSLPRAGDERSAGTDRPRAPDNPRSSFSHAFLLLVALFISCLIAANIIAVKVVEIFGLVLPAAIIIFPLSYILGDVLTEVYGYHQARRVIWLGFLCNLIVVAAIEAARVMPAAHFWEGQESFERILGYTPRLLVASFLAYLIGEFANAFVLAKMKIATGGRWLWTRTIGSTIIGQALDSAVFITLAFAGTIPSAVLASAIVTQWLVKSVYEALATPLTYAAVNFLKRAEGIDHYDLATRFNPFRIAG